MMPLTTWGGGIVASASATGGRMMRFGARHLRLAHRFTYRARQFSKKPKITRITDTLDLLDRLNHVREWLFVAAGDEGSMPSSDTPLNDTSHVDWPYETASHNLDLGIDADSVWGVVCASSHFPSKIRPTTS